LAEVVHTIKNSSGNLQTASGKLWRHYCFIFMFYYVYFLKNRMS